MDSLASFKADGYPGAVSRRNLIEWGLSLASALALGRALPFLESPALGAERARLEVAYAGSMAPVMEGPLLEAARRELGFDLVGRAQGSLALARLIVAGVLSPDVFVTVTARPAELVLEAGKADCAYPFARTELVIAYSPRSRFRRALDDAAKAEVSAGAWRNVLTQAGFRFGRTDPRVDPLGLNIIFAMELAARYYHDVELVRRVLGEPLNPAQIFSEPELMARLEAGQLDASAAYLTQPLAFKLPYIALAREVNLGDEQMFDFYRQVSVELEGKTYRPEPLLFYALALKPSAQAAAASRFVRWLLGEQARAIFERYGYRSVARKTVLCRRR